MKRVCHIFLIILVLGINTFSADGRWRDLFDGTDLTGWEVLNGQAKYYVESGNLVGQTVEGQPNSFLCTKEIFSDFILEYEMKIDEGLNSGVQIRSDSSADYLNGRVHGYQVECDTSSRRWSGGIYDEAGRGWLYPLERNPKGQPAFKNGQWNKFRVEVLGNNIRTFVNGVMCADLYDDMADRGFIGLQVHSTGGKKQLAGKKVCWKNIRILEAELQEQRSTVDENVPVINYAANYLSDREKQQGWKYLWDGETTNGWRGAGLKEFPEKGWKIENGQLIVMPSREKKATKGGDIITAGKYRNFELEVDFKMTEGANSGIKYFVNPELNNGAGSTIGCEFQILDDKIHPDAKQGIDGNRTLASLYDLIPARNPNGKKIDQYGWNRARIVVSGAHVEHWLNNMKMVEYERRTQTWRDLVAKSKFRDRANFGESEDGHILLQYHGNEVHFRNIKIRVLE
ncbi:MAG: DUF1080 domain-containing protein [Candidatus Brocadiia bacterium]|nr:MAG: DUF1080 domain-containing protein [Candidatus Brocadiia bacterium]